MNRSALSATRTGTRVVFATYACGFCDKHIRIHLHTFVIHLPTCKLLAYRCIVLAYIYIYLLYILEVHCIHVHSITFVYIHYPRRGQLRHAAFLAHFLHFPHFSTYVYIYLHLSTREMCINVTHYIYLHIPKVSYIHLLRHSSAFIEMCIHVHLYEYANI